MSKKMSVEAKEILLQIRDDIKEKFNNDPLINRVLSMVIGEFELRSKELTTTPKTERE